MLVWPRADAVMAAARQWAERVGRQSDAVVRVGCFGSYARGQAGVGSDLDLLVIVADCQTAFERRAALWDTSELPVAADLLVYTLDEWGSLRETAFGRTVATETVWLFERHDTDERPL